MDAQGWRLTRSRRGDRLAGLANHACDANAVWAFESAGEGGEGAGGDGKSAGGDVDVPDVTAAPRLVFRALRPLHPGEEVRISYVLPREPVTHRY